MLTFEEAVRELYFSRYGQDRSNYHAELYRLIAKADPVNRALLRQAYPMEVRAWEEWAASKDEVEFFRQSGMRLILEITDAAKRMAAKEQRRRSGDS